MLCLKPGLSAAQKIVQFLAGRLQIRIDTPPRGRPGRPATGVVEITPYDISQAIENTHRFTIPGLRS
jgi:hypothetical protein